MENYKYIYKHRRGTADQWKNSKIIPEEAELIVELDKENYKHKLKLGDGIHTYENLSYLTAGGETVTQTLARTVSVTLYASAWEEVTCESDPNIGYYKQTLNIDGIVSNSKVDLQPTADMIAIFQSKNLAFVTETVIENDVPTIICYSIGSTPSSDYTLQATVTEVEVDGNNIIGNTVSTIPNLDDYATESFVEDKVEELEPLITTTSRHLPSSIVGALSEGRRVVVTDNGTPFGKLVFDNFVYFEEDNVVKAYTFSSSDDAVLDQHVYRIYGYISSNEWFTVQETYPTKTGDLYNDAGYITEIQLESSVKTALTQAKESGEFDGTSVTIASISESTEDDGNNIVTFSDGNTLTVQNGSQGVSGVYVGPGDMPNGYNVQIDPDGDLTDISGVYVGSGEMPEGYNVQIDPDGDVIDEADLKGADGLSAYQIWLQQGNTGSEADFIASLEGTDGTSIKIEDTYQSTIDGGINKVKFSDGTILDIRNGTAGSKAVYVGSGEMPEEAVLQFSLDDVDEEQALKDELKEYIDTELDSVIESETLINSVAEQVKAEVPLVKVAEQPIFINSVDEMTDTSKIYVMPDGYMWAYKDGQWQSTGHAFIPTDYEDRIINLESNSLTAEKDILQNLGEEESRVMSQKAVTESFRVDSGFLGSEKSLEKTTTNTIYRCTIPAGESYSFFIYDFVNIKYFNLYLDLEDGTIVRYGKTEVTDISNGFWFTPEVQTQTSTFRIYATVSDDIGSEKMYCYILYYLNKIGNFHTRFENFKSDTTANIEENQMAIAELNASVYEIPTNLYEGDILEGGYYNDATWVENEKYKMAFLPFNSVQSGEVISYSPEYSYYNGSYRFDAFADDGTWLAMVYYGTDTNFSVPNISAATSFKLGMRLKSDQDESNLIIAKGYTVEKIDKVEQALGYIQEIKNGSLYGKTINCLGDSFTASASSWHSYIAQRTGCVINNYGVSSSRISIDISKTTETDEDGNPITSVIDSFITRASDMDATADITVIFGGINDAQTIYSGGITLGDINSELNTSTFYGALRLLITNIQSMMPGKKIIGVIPPDYIPYPISEQYYQTLPQIQKACREVYEYYGIPYADLKKECQEMFVNDYNVATFRRVTSTSNNYHPSKMGYNAISEIIQGTLERVIKSV